MNKNDLIDEILNDNSTEYSKGDLEQMLNNELNKPYSERDYDLINEITQYIIQLDEKDVDVDIEHNINKIIERHSTKKRKYSKFLRIPVTASIIFVILFSANIVSISAFNIDLFNEIVEFGGDIVKFDFNKKETDIIELKTSIDDPYGIKGELEKLGMSSMAPTYIPEGFELENLETDGIDDNDYNNLLLHYKKDKYVLNIDITEYKDSISSNIGVISETGNLQQVRIKDIDVFIVSEDGKYRTIFPEGLVVYGVSTNLDYEDLIKILESFE